MAKARRCAWRWRRHAPAKVCPVPLPNRTVSRTNYDPALTRQTHTEAHVAHALKHARTQAHTLACTHTRSPARVHACTPSGRRAISVCDPKAAQGLSLTGSLRSFLAGLQLKDEKGKGLWRENLHAAPRRANRSQTTPKPPSTAARLCEYYRTYHNLIRPTSPFRNSAARTSAASELRFRWWSCCAAMLDSLPQCPFCKAYQR